MLVFEKCPFGMAELYNETTNPQVRGITSLLQPHYITVSNPLVHVLISECHATLNSEE